MDILLGVGGVLLALLALAVALGLIGAIGYLLYIPIRSGWAIMRLLLERIGLHERDSPTEGIAHATHRIYEEVKEIRGRLDER